MHRLSLISLTALMAVGGVLAFSVFVSPQTLAAPAPTLPTQPATTHAPTPTSTGNSTSTASSTNSTLLTGLPTSHSGSGDDGPDGGSGDN
ncbi:MAG: hypothetical protein JRN06_05225 [Nitrososphaerota archaeon]|nr:hypothetical protein [Nitrososphaerota archaeon]